MVISISIILLLVLWAVAVYIALATSEKNDNKYENTLDGISQDLTEEYYSGENDD